MIHHKISVDVRIFLQRIGSVATENVVWIYMQIPKFPNAQGLIRTIL